MILSVSRRTDVPNYYSEWFMNRVKAGFLYVRNPMNIHQVSKILLDPDLLDCIVFWTKNPRNMMGYIDDLKAYPFYFQFTLTGYGSDLEPNMPSKREELIPTFAELSKKIGKEKVIWRYDPIILTDKYTVDYHVNAFDQISAKLKEYTEKVVISFVDFYSNTIRNMSSINTVKMTTEAMEEIAEKLSAIAHNNGLQIESCAELIDLSKFGIGHGRCIDDRLIERIIGCKLNVKKDKNQRKECSCIESVEIGAYNTCKNGCRYCYANFNDKKVVDSVGAYDMDSPLLCGVIEAEDVLTERKVKTYRDNQISLDLG